MWFISLSSPPLPSLSSTSSSSSSLSSSSSSLSLLSLLLLLLMESYCLNFQARYVNRCVVRVDADVSFHYIYVLFRTLGLSHAMVTGIKNDVVGIITREELTPYNLKCLARRNTCSSDQRSINTPPAVSKLQVNEPMKQIVHQTTETLTHTWKFCPTTLCSY